MTTAYDLAELVRLQSVRDIQNPPAPATAYEMDAAKQPPPIITTLIAESDALILTDDEKALTLKNMQTAGNVRWDAGSRETTQPGAGQGGFSGASDALAADFIGSATTPAQLR